MSDDESGWDGERERSQRRGRGGRAGGASVFFQGLDRGFNLNPW